MADLEAQRTHPQKETAKAGWGSWAGMGARPAQPSKRALAEAEKAKLEAEKAKKARSDASLPTVIINQKRHKASARLKIAQIPYPFTSKEQYERSMRQPLGPEWNTPSSVRELTRPQVIFQPGAVIDPLKLPKSARKAKAPPPKAKLSRGF
eukprot:TRINITY_DN10265_c0_g1_i1.p2 TRINITY_DN10265_c0_g1~~TRINITY_DN10265_c0_g1_i1.p2  ORF type:complete len:158 (-),score=23.50 TRINITY_DN10265_c0_g1_i1:168-620(-)